MKKIERKNFIDVILFAFAVYLAFTTNWSNIDKFSQLLLLMYALCITLRIGNIMKIKQNEMIQRQKQNEQNQQNQNENTITENKPKQ
ncbi:hypothetical protein [Clostridium sp. MD294]|uniref:hypothetical protein n=1 Tax=Clostridium sp. MD294 TaxID=97138 RepID=UPI0002C955B6|nr:hypothetical protein [Clostridium sp. MD294]NDO47732.1 hypothetical protein [Clostridium sp. MD294]USF29950.1 hypothetical protein C820_001370 [Clostridium sp. MD294]